jgi:hypothetical protein
LAATWLRPASEKKFELSELLIAFEDTEDLRSSINRLHHLVSVRSIAVLAVLCGADGPASIRGWAAARQQFLERFPELPHGLPSLDVTWREDSLQTMERRMCGWSKECLTQVLVKSGTECSLALSFQPLMLGDRALRAGIADGLG